LEHATGAYFWSDAAIGSGGTVYNKIFIDDLPPGNYTVVCYQARKNGPIRTQKDANSNSDSSCSGKTLPVLPATPVGMPSIQLTSSWNVFTSPFYSSSAENQHTINSTTTPTDPWLFVTLSVFGWNALGNAVNLAFDHNNLTYAGAIINNAEALSSSSDWQYISNIAENLSGTLTIGKGSNIPDNNQTHIYLIFKKKTGGNLDQLSTLSFDASVRTVHGTLQANTTPSVKGAPHDPNGLVVDKDLLCSCQSEKKLIYNVDFQNIGNASVMDVTIELRDVTGLNLSLLKILNSTGSPKTGFTQKTGADVSFNIVDRKFTIDNINLPGKHQPGYSDKENQTWDSIEFELETNPCLKDGVSIQPIARVVFVGVPGYLDTNIGKTQVVGKIKQEPCPPPHAKCKTCKKKPCWLFSWLKGKNKG